MEQTRRNHHLWIRPSRPNVAAILAGLKRCSHLRDVETGRKIHGLVVEIGLFSDVYVTNSLISFYSKCGSMVHARSVFDSMLQLDVVSWNSLIQGYVDNGEEMMALMMFSCMQEQGLSLPDARTYLSVVSAYTSLVSKSEPRNRDWLEVCRIVHSRAVKSRCCDVFVENALIKLYAECKSMEEARAVFDRMTRRDVVSWNTLLQGYVDNEESELALELFEQMERNRNGFSADARTYLVALKALAAVVSKETRKGDRNRCLEAGKSVHSRALASRCSDIYVESAMVDLYGKSGDVVLAREAFDRMNRKNVVSWTALIQGYVENGEFETALVVFDSMENAAGGCSPNPRTFLVALSACAALAVKRDGKTTRWLEKGKDLHSRAAKRNCCDIYVENTLLNMYCKCGSLVDARSVFDKMSFRNVVSWNSMVLGYVENGENVEALKLVEDMKSDGFHRDSSTYVAVLLACGNLTALERGKQYHAEIQRRGVEEDVATNLVQFYGKCESFNVARLLFESLVCRNDDIWAWNALICGCSQQGNAEQVFQLFKEMKEQGVSPDEFTFTHILATCCHGGLADRGKECFEVMKTDYGISPDVVHYSCMVDLLARGDRVDEALKLIRDMPFEGNPVTWFAVLAACGRQVEVVQAKVAYDVLLELDEDDPAAYVLLANMLHNKKNFLNETEGHFPLT